MFQIQHSDTSGLLAYSLEDGTVGMYNEGIRLWRIKVIRHDRNHSIWYDWIIFYFQSKSKGLSMACYDLVGTGNLQLIIGWKSGKVSKQQID